jgi:hypothetical protein
LKEENDSMNPEVQDADLLASPVELVDTALPTERPSFQSHSRTMSAAADFSSTAKRNRNSVHFPMQLTALREQVVPFSSSQDVYSSGTTSAEPFLTALAAQERKVLELREDLHRAEKDLTRLKKQWAKQEGEKKKQLEDATSTTSPIAQASPLVALEDMDTTDASQRAQMALERRKSLLQKSKPSNRTVFSGSRHTRKLSLLATAVDPKLSSQSMLASPDATGDRPDEHDANEVTTEKGAQREPSGPLSPGIDQAINLLDSAMDHELIIRTGKKFAADFKDGLITFWEDIRQATVGEEATQTILPRKSSVQAQRAPRKQSSKNSLHSSRSSLTSTTNIADNKRASAKAATSKPSALPDLSDTTFWTENLPASSEAVPTTPSTARPAKSAVSPAASRALNLEEDDSWETWNDSPRQSRHSSDMASETYTAPSTVSASPRTSTSTNPDNSDFLDKDAEADKDTIPWPALSKLGPSALQRTASTLMREWEKSLSPSPVEESHDKFGDLKKD